MLCCVADALVKFFPDENVYRIGGDEFVVTSVKLSKQTVEHIVEKCIMNFSRIIMKFLLALHVESPMKILKKSLKWTNKKTILKPSGFSRKITIAELHGMLKKGESIEKR